MSEREKAEIACSDAAYNLANFAIVTFVLGMFLASPFLLNNSMSKLWIVFSSAASFIVSSLIAAYIYLNKTRVYESGNIGIEYFIKHGSISKKDIELNNIIAVKYSYTGGRGSGGIGVLKVNYVANGEKEKIKCPMDRSSAATVCSLMKKKKISIEVKPSWVLNEYGFNNDLRKSL